MRTRKIGSLEVSLIGLGCNDFGGRLDAAATRAVVDAALESGVTLFDTADVYGGGGGSEELLGRALGSRRAEAVVATKFGAEIDEEPRGAHPDHVRAACQASLRRLGTDHIDLYQLHRPDPEVPIAETLGALDELVREGLVRELGHSNHSASQMDAAGAAAEGFGTAAFVCAQERYNVLEREIERGVLPAVERHGLALLPYFPLASGLLTGKYRADQPPDAAWRLGALPEDRRARHLTDARLETVARLSAFAEDRGRTVLELAMSWLARQSPVASVIAGATRPEQVRANAAAADWHLTADESADIDRITAIA